MPDGIGFLQNVIKIIDAIEKFADIYAEKAKELGRTDIYEIFQRIPKNGAHSLREALQFLRLLQFVQRYDFNGLTPIGRFDQFMFPYFVADLNAENLDYNQALELIEEYFLNLNKNSDLFFGVQKGDNGQSLVLGGLDSNRFNAYNQLSEICLKVSLELCLIDPKINLRVNKETPIEIFELGTELTKCGLGFPQYSNDDIVIPGLVSLGYNLEDAMNYAVAACWEFIIPGYGMEIVNFTQLPFLSILNRIVTQDLGHCH